MRLFRLVLTVTVFLSVPPVLAGVADSPLPVLEAGKTTLHLYTVPGVLSVAGLDTFFSCTSMDTAAMKVGVDLFASSGGTPINDAVATSLTVNPGATVIFATDGTVAGIPVNSDVGGGPGHGSARILSTSKKLACTAFIADADNAPPTSAWQLTIIAKTKQKAAN